MHRHTYQGRKLQLDAGPRRALLRGQVTSLVLHEAITTTEAKAKEVAPYFERLVTHAKKNTLAGGRTLRANLLTEAAVQKLLLELTPAFADRQGGYTRIIKLGNRRGDNAPMVRLSLVLDGGVKGAPAPARPAKAKQAGGAKTRVAKPKAAADAKARAEEAETVEVAA
ncbi:MAG TPA: 50S ribosomal protein L17 [Candidatus Saccharimonadia bacterium]